MAEYEKVKDTPPSEGEAAFFLILILTKIQ